MLVFNDSTFLMRRGIGLSVSERVSARPQPPIEFRICISGLKASPKRCNVSIILSGLQAIFGDPNPPPDPRLVPPADFEEAAWEEENEINKKGLVSWLEN